MPVIVSRWAKEELIEFEINKCMTCIMDTFKCSNKPINEME